MTVNIILLHNSTAFSQVRNDTACYYQAPKITCEQAQKNAEAIVKYPLALKSMSIKDEMIRTKENELSNVKDGFNDERKLNTITISDLTKNYQREIRRKKRWRILTGIVGIFAVAFYAK